MKRNLMTMFGALLMAAFALTAANAQTGDNLPTNDKLSVVGEAPAPLAADASADKTEAPGNAAPADGQPKAAEGANAQAAATAQPAKDPLLEKQKADQQWQKKLQDAQSQIDMLTRELDVANREYRLRAAAFYADAGNRLRNSGAWDKEDEQFKEQIAAKQKAIDDAKKSFEDMQEQARKAGVPSGMRE